MGCQNDDSVDQADTEMAEEGGELGKGDNQEAAEKQDTEDSEATEPISQSSAVPEETDAPQEPHRSTKDRVSQSSGIDMLLSWL